MKGNDFPIHNLPYGVFRQKAQHGSRLATALGEDVIDVTGLALDGNFSELGINAEDILKTATYWNDFAALGREIHSAYRKTLTTLLAGEDAAWRQYAYPTGDVDLQLPICIGDYTDFWCSETHALNGGTLNRGTAKLPAAWYRLPGGYMGRASSIGVNQNVHRPIGQYQLPGNEPELGPCQKFDFELEFAWVIGKGNQLGKSIPLEESEEHLFGAMLMNDWSARDFALYEVQAGGVTTCKNFATTVSPWIVSMDALQPFKIDLPPQEPPPARHLAGNKSRSSYNVGLEAHIGSETSSKAICLVETNLSHIYWSPSQMIAHFTVSGANFRPGDIFGTGTVSGPQELSWACLMERSWGGTREWAGPDGRNRKWLEDGDTVSIVGYCEANGVRIGFGECFGRVLPSL